MDTLLSQVEFLKPLTAAERQRLVALSREKRYAKGQTIFRAGEPSEAIWIVKVGRIHLMKFLESGQASTTCVMKDGEPFCCLPAMDRQPYPVDAVAAVDSVVYRIPLDAFHELLQKNPAFLRASLCVFCDRLRQVEHKSCMSADPVDHRLAHVLVELSKKFGRTIPLTKQQLAEMAGTTVETTIRILGQFKKRGLITSSRGSTTLAKLDRLQDLAGS